ncbi:MULTISPECIES: tetratricopeptide repeat-containing protein [unclassified Rhizobium]|uniref:ATP-grasp domain-containing protein n=1 Tax=unclassified Rhizobium TaxID=2613769 RepID=UPI000EA85354|nr:MULTISPECIES: tetratricopeptide repeat-containing protein [unclassified Rhizobium]AYG65209.1 tetratricopeptide repeat-containing protein [Rhizobium sp. CCGE531]AYG71693.1 tetratricopeptide repeat-containing protein [Rhizobium sp. CCGE532]
MLMTKAPMADPAPLNMPVGARILGMQRIVSLVYAGHDVAPLWSELMQRVTADPTDAAALLDMAIILQTLARGDEARQILKSAVQMRRDFCIVHGDGAGPRLLAFVTEGDFMANTPLDFLLAGSDCVLWLRYVDLETSVLADLPDHDVAFMAIGESTENAPLLAHMQALLAKFDGPVMNCNPELIARLTRDGVSSMLANEPSILSPFTYRVSHADLTAVAARARRLDDCAPGLAYPLVVRPISTHAGNGMERITDSAELAAFLEAQPVPELYVAPFIDFRGTDGLYNKQRVVFIDGKAFASHMALSDHWIVHYLSAGMAQSAAKRAVEQAWMENFDQDFAVRHKESFAALCRYIQLDYFGIDCAELPDGRLLVFELDVAMVVHDMDDPIIYPYKQVAMRKLFDGFVDAVRQRAAATLAKAS